MHGQENVKKAEFYSKNKFEKLLLLVGFITRLQHLVVYSRIYNSTFHTNQQIFRKQYLWEKDFL